MNIILFKEGVNTFKAQDERYSHIKKVIKLKAGDSFKAGVINKSSGMAKITNFDSESIDFVYTAESYELNMYPLTILLAMVRPICMKRILRELSSLGIQKLILCPTDLGEKSYLSSSLYTSSEAEDILINGAMQSGYAGLTELVIKPSLKAALAECGPKDKFVLDIKESRALNDLTFLNNDIVLALGGERGWSENERQLFKTNNFEILNLGNRILRTETAVVAATAMAISKFK